MSDIEKPLDPAFSDQVAEIAHAYEELEGMVKDLGHAALGGPEEVLHEGDNVTLRQEDAGLVVEINPPSSDTNS